MSEGRRSEVSTMTVSFSDQAEHLPRFGRDYVPATLRAKGPRVAGSIYIDMRKIARGHVPRRQLD
jgi:hypothetical protein